MTAANNSIYPKTYVRSCNNIIIIIILGISFINLSTNYVFSDALFFFFSNNLWAPISPFFHQIGSRQQRQIPSNQSCNYPIAHLETGYLEEESSSTPNSLKSKVIIRCFKFSGFLVSKCIAWHACKEKETDRLLARRCAQRVNSTSNFCGSDKLTSSHTRTILQELAVPSNPIPSIIPALLLMSNSLGCASSKTSPLREDIINNIEKIKIILK